MLDIIYNICIYNNIAYIICILIGEITSLIKYYFVTVSFTHGGDLQTKNYTMKPTKKTLKSL